jgi:predicted RNA-binding protein YlqC (UPF0109 family)
MSEIDQQFIEYVVKSLVSKPDAVSIERTIDEKGVLLQLTVDPEDLGRVIGKRGATAQSLRTLLRALGTKNDARYNLKIVDNGEGGHSDGGSRHKPAGDDRPKRSRGTDADDDTSAEEPAQPEENTEPEPEAAPEPEPEPEKPAEEEPSPEDETGDRLAKTRQELADLDDLDV